MAGFNYSNRNASNPDSTKSVAISYVGATTVACTAAVGLNALAKKRFAPDALATRLTPWAAVVLANVCNLSLMRWKEVVHGVDVLDQHGNALGKSVVAGKYAVAYTAVSRVSMSTPLFLLPPVALHALAKTMPIINRTRVTRVVSETVAVTLCLCCVLPPAIAIFPQKFGIDASKLEQRFQTLRDKDGNLYASFVVDKGV